MEIIAHRGASAHAPEHTWLAYDLAVADGADTLEIDVRLSADHRLTAIHDATLWRTARDPRPIAELTRADVKALPKAVRPLRLSRILERYEHRCRFLLDLKEPTPPMERRLFALVRDLGLEHRVVVQSLEEGSLRRLARRGLAVAPLDERRPGDRALDRARNLGAAGITVRHEHVTAALIDGAAARGLAVRAWTVNEAAQAVRLAALGVDGLITDDPGAIRAAVVPPALAA